MWLLLACSILTLVVCAWIVIPTPTGHLLPLAVGSAELSPVLLVIGGALCVIAGAWTRRNRTARLTLTLAAASTLLSLVPVVQLPFALRRFDERMAAVSSEPPRVRRGDVRVTRGIQFSKSDGVPLSLDLYQPPEGHRFPVVLQIYGGSWQTGSPSSQEWFSRHFAQRGYLVVAIDYGMHRNGNGPSKSSTSEAPCTGFRKTRRSSAAIRAESSW